jgi:hypothetical protein
MKFALVKTGLEGFGVNVGVNAGVLEGVEVTVGVEPGVLDAFGVGVLVREVCSSGCAWVYWLRSGYSSVSVLAYW